MRIVWLALFCLIGLATTVLAKLMSPYATAAFSRGVPFPKAEVSRGTSVTDAVTLSSENVTAGTKLQNDRWTKADKLEVSYTNEAAPEITSVKSVAIVSPTVAIVSPATEPEQLPRKLQRIVSRHWHDPLDKRSVSAAARPTVKRKVSNTSTNRSHMVTTRAPKS
jgi:hypothetical protein